MSKGSIERITKLLRVLTSWILLSLPSFRSGGKSFLTFSEAENEVEKVLSCSRSIGRWWWIRGKWKVSLEIELRFGDQVRQRSCTHLDVSFHSLLASATHTVNPVKEPLVPVINCQVPAESEKSGVLTYGRQDHQVYVSS